MNYSHHQTTRPRQSTDSIFAIPPLIILHSDPLYSNTRSFVFIPRKHQHSPPTHESAYISQTNKIRIIVVSISHKQLGIRLFYAETDLQHIIRKYPPKPLPSINTVLVPYQFWESLKITRNTRLLDCNHHCFTYSVLMIFKLEIPGKQSQHPLINMLTAFLSIN